MKNTLGVVIALILALGGGAALAGKAKYRVYCPEESENVKYGNDKDSLEQWSTNHNTGRGHSSYVTNHG